MTRPPRPPPPPLPLSSRASPLPLPVTQALNLSYWFYEAQRSGKLPPGNRVPWRRDAMLGDAVVGGYHDAGDHIKHALTAAETVVFLAWSALDFQAGHNAGEEAGQTILRP